MRVIRSALLPTAPGYLGYGLLGLLMGVLWPSMGALSAALVLLPLIVARWAISQYRRAGGVRVDRPALVQAVETKDLYTRGHSERVATASVMIAGVLGMRDERVNALRYAGMLHDVGKLGVPTKILHKTSGPDRRTSSPRSRCTRSAARRCCRTSSSSTRPSRGSSTTTSAWTACGYPMGLRRREHP